MTSREEETAAKLRSYLDRSAVDLRPGLAYRLQQARAQALSRLSESPQEAGAGRLVGAHGLIGAGAGGGAFEAAGARPPRAVARLWTGVAVLAVALFAWQQWTAWEELAEVEALDAQILTSDLPIDALVDRGFHLFLELAPSFAPDGSGERSPEADAAEGQASSTPAPARPAE